MRRTKILTLCAAIVALSVVLMLLGSLVEVLDLVMLFIVSIGLAFTVIEFGGIWPWMTYAATAVLAVLLLPNKFTAWEYAAIVGFLPILKSYFEKLPRVLGGVLKYVSFNLLFAGALAIFYFLLGMSYEAVALFTVTIPAYAVPILLCVLGNICYVCYDVLLTRLITIYYVKFRDRVRRALRL